MNNYLIVLTSLELGGAERQAINFADFLLKSGQHVDVIGFCNPGKIVEMCQDKGIPCRLIEDRRGGFSRKISHKLNSILGRDQEIENYKFLSRMLAKYIKDNKVDFCISYCSPANTISCYAKKYYPNCAYTWYQRDDGLCYEPFAIRNKAIHLADHVLSNGISGYNWISENHKIESKVIHNGVVKGIPRKSVDDWRNQLGITKNQVVCTMIAHFSKVKKNHYQNVNVFKKLVDDGYKDFVMLFAGRPDDTDYYNDIKTFVIDNHLEDYVKFLGEVDDIAGLLTITDICFFGTNREGNPNGIIEAAMLGLPVVASDLPEIREVVAEENYKYLFKNGDYESAEKNLIELGCNHELRIKSGKLNADKANADFSVEKNFEELMESIK